MADLFINSSGLPKSYPLGDGTSHIQPRLRPGAGLHVIGESRRGIWIDLSARYINPGLTDQYHYRGTDPNDDTPYSVDRTEVYSFQKVGFGLGAGYRFKLFNSMLRLSAGYRHLQFVSGNYSYTYISQDAHGGSLSVSKDFNPFTDPDLDRRGSRNGHEFYFSAGIKFGSHLCISFQYSLPSDIIFIENINGHNSNDYHAFLNNDASLCVSWIF